MLRSVKRLRQEVRWVINSRDVDEPNVGRVNKLLDLVKGKTKMLGSAAEVPFADHFDNDLAVGVDGNAPLPDV